MDASKLSVLDFDGVICDSAYENAATAWRVCHRLWPADFAAQDVPDEDARKFCAVRPYLETGWQSIVMTWALYHHLPQEQFTTKLDASVQALLEQMRYDKATLLELFRNERKQWLETSPASWLALHSFYPGVATAFAQLQTQCEVRILTTKETRFVRELFAFANIAIDDAKILGLDRIVNKQQSLNEFLQSGSFRQVSFIEDRYETLRKCIANPALTSLRLFLAGWGYNTDAQRDAACTSERITLLQNPRELPQLSS